MINSFGFVEDFEQLDALAQEEPVLGETGCACRSVVRVRFPGRGMPLTYYNDRFDLQPGDCVYVDGKLAGIKGTVVEVSRSFKIRPSAYQRVICRVDTHVAGRFDLVGRHFLTFDRTAIPYEKLLPWFCAPSEEEYVTGDDDSGFDLEELEKMAINPTIACRGEEYCENGHVVYLSLDRHRGRSIVRGTQAYEVEFDLTDGRISGLTCTCPCAFACKHEYAAMLQLRELLGTIENQYADSGDYFAAIDGTVLLSGARRGKATLVLSDNEEADCVRF